MSALTTLTAAEARRVLSLRDLTDPHHGHHAVQDLVDAIAAAIDDPTTHLRCRRANPVVTVGDNYDRLGYEPDAAARDARYSRYLTNDLMLRAHTSAMIPVALEHLPDEPDVTLLCPGMVYRRDVIDRQHVGEPHQLDVWRVRRSGAPPLDEDDLDDLIASIVGTVLPVASGAPSPLPTPTRSPAARWTWPTATCGSRSASAGSHTPTCSPGPASRRPHRGWRPGGGWTGC